MAEIVVASGSLFYSTFRSGIPNPFEGDENRFGTFCDSHSNRVRDSGRLPQSFLEQTKAGSAVPSLIEAQQLSWGEKLGGCRSPPCIISWGTQMRIRPILKCPFCHEIFPNAELTPRGPMTCPTCHHQLQHTKSRSHFSILMITGITIVLSWCLGLRGIGLAVLSVALWFPMTCLWVLIYSRLIPPKLEAYEPRHHDLSLLGR
jgi:hypothetical protein